jgi:FMN-dependent NADH-azoreductase
MTNDRHHRIHADGTCEDLPALEEAFFYAAEATEAEKEAAEAEYHAHNKQVLEELKKEGFA